MPTGLPFGRGQRLASRVSIVAGGTPCFLGGKPTAWSPRGGGDLFSSEGAHAPEDLLASPGFPTDLEAQETLLSVSPELLCCPEVVEELVELDRFGQKLAERMHEIVGERSGEVVAAMRAQAIRWTKDNLPEEAVRTYRMVSLDILLETMSVVLPRTVSKEGEADLRREAPRDDDGIVISAIKEALKAFLPEVRFHFRAHGEVIVEAQGALEERIALVPRDENLGSQFDSDMGMLLGVHASAVSMLAEEINRREDCPMQVVEEAPRYWRLLAKDSPELSCVRSG